MTTLEADKCVICYDGHTAEDVQTITYGCGHKFHSTCLFGWIDATGRNNNSSRCPQCRQTVIKWPERARSIRMPIELAIQRQHWAFYIVVLCHLMVLFLLICTSFAFLTTLTEPTITRSYDNTTQCASPSQPSLKINDSLLVFLHNNYLERYRRTGPDDFFYTGLVFETGFFYSSLYAIHIFGTILNRISITATRCIVTVATWDTTNIYGLAELWTGLIDNERLFLRRLSNAPPHPCTEEDVIMWDHLNRSGATVIENIATFILYIAHAIAIMIVFMMTRVQHIFSMGNYMISEEEILRLLGSSAHIIWEDFYKYGILSLRCFDSNPAIIIRSVHIIILVFEIPMLYISIVIFFEEIEKYLAYLFLTQ